LGKLFCKAVSHISRLLVIFLTPRSLGIGGLVACSIVGYGWYRYMTENIKGNARSGYKAQQDAKSKSSAKQKETK
jgi:hypothetical protein